MQSNGHWAYDRRVLMMKKTFIIAILLGILGFTLLTGCFYPNPPVPEITYGEFPFKLTYEVDGEIKIIEDTVICEFDGFKSEGENGKHRKWKARLKSGDEQVTMLKIDETFKLYCSYDLPEYYMDDLRFMSRVEYEQMRERDLNSYFIILGKYDNGKEAESNFISADEAWDRYNFRILDRKYTPPIQNSFE